MADEEKVPVIKLEDEDYTKFFQHGQVSVRVDREEGISPGKKVKVTFARGTEPLDGKITFFRRAGLTADITVEREV